MLPIRKLSTYSVIKCSSKEVKAFFEFIINSFVPNAPFLYPLKTSKNGKFSDVSRGLRKGALRTNGLRHEKKNNSVRNHCLKLYFI